MESFDNLLCLDYDPDIFRNLLLSCQKFLRKEEAKKLRKFTINLDSNLMKSISRKRDKIDREKDDKDGNDRDRNDKDRNYEDKHDNDRNDSDRNVQDKRELAKQNEGNETVLDGRQEEITTAVSPKQVEYEDVPDTSFAPESPIHQKDLEKTSNRRYVEGKPAKLLFM